MHSLSSTKNTVYMYTLKKVLKTTIFRLDQVNTYTDTGVCVVLLTCQTLLSRHLWHGVWALGSHPLCMTLNKLSLS